MLAGQTILIVETEFLVALDIQRCLETLGATQTVFARDTAEALSAIARWPGFSLALVEIRPGHADDITLMQGLHQAGVKLILLTADGELHAGPPGFAAPTIVMPFLEADLVSAIRQALTP